MTKEENMKINVVENIKDAKLITHAGTFHADEVFATIVLNYALDDEKINLSRVLDIENAKEDAIIYDIGGGKFDHHQKGGNGIRKDGVPYASFGLIWKEYGRKCLENLNVEKEVINDSLEMIDKKLIEAIDAIDNGELSLIAKPKIDVNTISDLIGKFNSNWDEDETQNNRFLEAIEFADKIFIRTVRSIESKLKARSYIEEAIKKSENDILVLDTFMPWKEWLLYSKNKKAKDILYVVYKSNREGYSVQTVPKGLNTFENRKSLPKEWSGLRGKDFKKKTGVKTATFCHNACFICGAEEKEDAIKLAKIAVES